MRMGEILKFPPGFLWGSATSAYQVEGGIENSDWSKGYRAGLACDHYNRYEEDFDLLQKLNQNGYRFSIEWSRVEPESGLFDEQELEHYRRILFSLRRRNIQTFVTLHHFTSPDWFAKAGGWTNAKAPYYFSRFAERLLEEYKGLVDFWITINEPMIYAAKGYLDGTWLTRKKNPILFLKVLHNQTLAHKKIYELFHKKAEVRVGIAKNNQFFESYNRKSFLDRAVVKLADYFMNRWFLNRIAGHLDFIGFNYYFYQKIAFPRGTRNENKKISDIGWEVYPEGIYHVLSGLKKYQKTVYVTENGVADNRDLLRRDFIRGHLYWIHKAIQGGVDVRGYLHWSLIDNFEWEKGFEPRFGLVEVDYKALERKIRPSAYYYSEICRNNGFEH